MWDCGLYSPDTGGKYSFHDREEAQARVRDELATGKLSFFLAGVKLKGSFALVRISKDWLLIKHHDNVKSMGENAQGNQSVLSPHSVQEVPAQVERIPFAQLTSHEPAEPFPAKLGPMSAQAGKEPFSHHDWLFEPKLDGYRVIAFLDGARVRISSKNGIDLTGSFPTVAAELAQQPVQPMILDGELILFDQERPSFEALQLRAQLHTANEVTAAEQLTPCAFYCFDVLHAAGVNLRTSPYIDRRRYLAQCLLPGSSVKLVHDESDGFGLYHAAIATGLEGMVAKKKAGLYTAGTRSPDWLTVKAVQTSEFVIGGYLPGQGSRRNLGALLVGYWICEHAKLNPCVNH